MKNRKNTRLTLAIWVLINFCVNLHSLAQVTASEVIGSWVIDFNALNTEENRNDTFQYDSLSSEAKSNLRAAFEGRVFEFSVEQNVSIRYRVRGNERTVTGQWNLDEVGQEVTITAQNRQLTYDIHILGSTMYLKPKRVDANAAFTQLILNKNESR